MVLNFHPPPESLDLIHSLIDSRIAKNEPLHPSDHGHYLFSRGLQEDQVETLCAFNNHGFPDDKILAAKLGESQGTVARRINRARAKLGLMNRYQLVHLLTVLSGLDARATTAKRNVK